MRYIKKSLGRKLALAYGLLFITVFAGTYLYSSRVVEKREMRHLEEFLTQHGKLLRRTLTPDHFEAGRRVELVRMVRELDLETGMRITVILPDGTVAADSEVPEAALLEVANHASRKEVRDALSSGIGTMIHYSQTLKRRMLYVALPIRDGEKPAGVLRVAMPLNTVNEILDFVVRPLLTSFLAGIALVLGFSFFLSRSLSRRVGELTQAALAYKRGDFSRKVFIRSGDELEVLARSMNRMADELQVRIREIEAERKKFSAVIGAMAEGVIAVDRENRVLLVNPSAERIFGIRSAEAAGRSLIEAIRNPLLEMRMEQALAGAPSASLEMELPQLENKILQGSALGIASSGSEVAGILVISDITEIRRLENLRREFVANVSHELRTPLTSIQGFLETIREQAGLEPAQRIRFLEMIEEDTKRLVRLVEDLMELSRIESRKIQLRPGPLDLAPEVEKALRGIRPLAEKKRLTVQNRVAAKENLRVLADPDRLRQVLVNLLDNAVKFNREGGQIVLEARKQGKEVRISVRDTGAGIPPELLPRIFERFFRVDKARSRELGGTGLGLAIVKHLVEAQGGRVTCESEFEKGSVFHFTLPSA